MYEIRLHGRGGQGVVLASRIIAAAFFKEGKHVQAFPSFGAERRGAPVVSYARASDTVIEARFGIYKPDCVIVLEPRLLNGAAVYAGLKPEGWIILNAREAPGDERLRSHGRVVVVDADGLALKFGLGSAAQPIVNAAVLGALPRVTDQVTVDSIVDAVRETVPAKAEENSRAALEAYRTACVLSPGETP